MDMCKDNNMSLFSENGYQDLLFLATVLHQNETDKDFDYDFMVSFLSEKYAVPEQFLNEIGHVFYRYMEEEGGFLK